jgi:hypothetical protein
MDLNAYFKQLAEEHAEILHSDNAETKGYFRAFNSSSIFIDGEIKDNLRYLSTNAIISQFNEDSSLPVPSNDYNRQTPSGSLFILSRIKDADIESARAKAIEIRNDIYARLKKDMRDGTILKGFQIESIQSSSIGRIASNLYGIVLFFSFTEHFAAPYNADKWTLT